MNTLKQNVEALASEEGKTVLEIISLLQAGAAAKNDKQALEALCDLKWEYL